MQNFTTPEFLEAQGFSSDLPQRFWANVNKNGPVPAHCPELGPCWLWKPAKGYQYGEIKRDSAAPGRSPGKAHRVSWILHYGAIPKRKRFVCHKCDNPRCVRPDHLFVGTHRDNMADMVAKGRSPRNYKCNLNSDQRIEIRSRHAAGVSITELAQLYRVHPNVIADLIRYKNRYSPLGGES